MITYEELTSPERSAETLRKVFNVCGLPESLIPEGLKALSRDSQAGTPLSQEAVKKFVSATLTTESIDRLKVMAEYLNFPVKMVK